MTIKPVKHVVLLAAFCVTGAAAQTPVPEQPTERTVSPYDLNPACRDRDVAGTDPACVIQDRLPARQSLAPNPAQPAQQNVAPSAPTGNAPAPPAIIVIPPQGSRSLSPGGSMGR
jgi:hypothetical protein